MTPDRLVRDATFAFLIVVPVVVGYQMLTGRIRLGGLICERKANGLLEYSPARLQLLLVTIACVVQYSLRFIQAPTALPNVDGSTLMGMGGSQLFYLARKGWAAYQAQKS